MGALYNNGTPKTWVSLWFPIKTTLKRVSQKEDNHISRGTAEAVSYLVESTEGYTASLFARFQQAGTGLPILGMGQNSTTSEPQVLVVTYLSATAIRVRLKIADPPPKKKKKVGFLLEFL